MLFAGITVIISLMGLFLMGLSFVQGVAVASVARRAADDGRLAHAAAGAARLGRHSGSTTPRGRRSSRSSSPCSAAIVGIVAGQGAVFLGGFVLADRAVRRELRDQAAATPGAAPRRAAARSSASGTGGAGSSSTGRGRARSAPCWSCSCWRSRCSRSVSGSATTATTPRSTTVRRAYDLIAEGFGPGTNGPLFVIVEGDLAVDPEALGAFVGHHRTHRRRRLHRADADQRCTRARDRLPRQRAAGRRDGRRSSTSSATTSSRRTGVDAKVGGLTAASTDFAEFLGGRHARC